MIKGIEDHIYSPNELWQLRVLDADWQYNAVPALFELETPFLSGNTWCFHADKPRTIRWLTSMAILKYLTFLLFNLVMVLSAGIGIFWAVSMVFAANSTYNIDWAWAFLVLFCITCPFIVTMIVLYIRSENPNGLMNPLSSKVVKTRRT